MNALGLTAPKIPREEWTFHPRFRNQALLLGSHSNFRRVSRYLIEGASIEQIDRYYRSPLSLLIADP